MTAAAGGPPLRKTGLRNPGLGGAVGLVAFLAAIPLFWFGAEGLLQEWAKPEFRFKALVPFFSAILFLTVLRDVESQPVRGWTPWLGAAGMAASLLLALLGNRLTIDDFVFLSIVFWCVGLVVTCFGLRGALAFWAPLGSLWLMVPLPRFILAPIQDAVEVAAAKAAVTCLALAGVPARLEGQVLDFAGFAVTLDAAAAGIECLLPLILLFFFFASFHTGPLWTRILPLLLAAPVVALTASARILGAGLAFAVGGEDASAGLLAFWNEWAFFGICIALLLASTLVAQRLMVGGPLRRPRDVDFGALGQEVGRALSGPCRPPLLAAAGASIAISALFLLAPAPVGASVERDPFRLFPPEIGAWTGSSAAIDPDTARVLEADDYVHIDFWHPSEVGPVSFWSAYYLEQKGDKGGIHSPQDCLPIDGWNILSFRQVDLGLADGGAVEVNRAVIEKGRSRAVVYYWFDGRGRRVANERLARILVKVDGFLKGRTDGALVRYTTLVHANETEADADARLRRLVSETIDKLPRFIPR